jgi:hypothetical protein
MTKKAIKKILESEDIVYENLRLDVLINLIDERNIDCKHKKDEIIKILKLDDDGKYIRPTTYEKDSGGYIIGVDIKNYNDLVELGKRIEKKEAKILNRFSSDYVYYWSNQKLI